MVHEPCPCIVIIIIIILAANRRHKYSNDAAQQGRTESLQRRLRQPLYGTCVTLEHSLQRDGISCMLVFGEGGKPEPPGEKPSKQRREPIQTQPTYGVGSGNRTRARMVGSKCSHHLAIPGTTVPPPPPFKIIWPGHDDRDYIVGR